MSEAGVKEALQINNLLFRLSFLADLASVYRASIFQTEWLALGTQDQRSKVR